MTCVTLADGRPFIGFDEPATRVALFEARPIAVPMAGPLAGRASGALGGDHLAPWAISRGSLPVASPLSGSPQLAPTAVISLGGVDDFATLSCFVLVLCGPGTVGRRASVDMLQEVSPAALTLSAGSIFMVSVALDQLVPPLVATTMPAHCEAGSRPRPGSSTSRTPAISTWSRPQG